MRKLHFLVLLLFFNAPLFAGFGAGTAVSSSSALIPIEQLQVGDLVDCYEQDASGERYAQKAVTCKQSHTAIEYLSLVIGESRLVVSPDQKLYLPEHQEWVQARDCAAGDLLFGRNGLVCIDDIFVVHEPVTFFDITVQDCHNFLVLPDGILVHNIFPIFVGITAAFGGGVVADWCLTAGIAGIAAIGIKLAKEKYGARHDVKIITGPGAGSGSPRGPDDDEKQKRAPKQEALTNRQAREAAKKMGFVETKDAPFDTKGALTFKKGTTYISADKTCHKGGVWKMFTKAEGRIGTWNIDLTKKIGH